MSTNPPKIQVRTNRWSWEWDLPDGHAPCGGLILESVSHDGFSLAREIRVASIWINPGAADTSLQRQLILGDERHFKFDGGLTIDATRAAPPFDAYEVEGAFRQKYVSAVLPGDRIFGEDMPPLLVTQTYRFSTYGNDPPHEPVGSLPAARLFPCVTFETKNPLITSIRVDYRLHLSFYDVWFPPARPDKTPLPILLGRPALSQAGVFRDHDDLPFGLAPVLAAFQLEDDLFKATFEMLSAIRRNVDLIPDEILRAATLKALEAVDALPALPPTQAAWKTAIVGAAATIRLGLPLANAMVESLIDLLRDAVVAAYGTSASFKAHVVKQAVLSNPTAAAFITQNLLFAGAEKPIPYEILGVGLDHGGTSITLDGAKVPTWDNIHVWPTGEGLPSTPGAFYAAHMHWRWGRVAALPTALEALAQKWIGVQKAGDPVLSVPAADGPLIDAAIRDQTIRFAIAVVPVPGKSITTEADFGERFEARDPVTGKAALPVAVEAGADLAVWMSFHVDRGSESTFGGTVFVNGLYFAHEPESEDNPFAFSRGDPILPHTKTQTWRRQPKP